MATCSGEASFSPSKTHWWEVAHPSKRSASGHWVSHYLGSSPSINNIHHHSVLEAPKSNQLIIINSSSSSMSSIIIMSISINLF